MYLVYYGFKDPDSTFENGYTMETFETSQEVGEFYTEWMTEEIDDFCNDIVFRVFEVVQELKLKEVEKVTSWELEKKV